MLNLAGLIRKLIALGASSEVIDAVAVAVQEDQEREAGRLEAHRQAVRRHRERKNINKINDRVISRRYHRDISQKTQQNQYPPSEVKPPHTPPLLSKRRVTTPITVDWRPDSSGLMLADQLGIQGSQLEEEISRFRDYCQANGRQYADPQAAFRNWLRSPYRHNGKGSTNAENPRRQRRTTFDACNDLMDRLREIEQDQTGTVDNQPYQPTLGKLP